MSIPQGQKNRAKSDKVTDRARVFAKELYDAKLLSEEGWKRVESWLQPQGANGLKAIYSP
jgi:hypothetical protein